jgi:cysteine-rich repeat protein
VSTIGRPTIALSALVALGCANDYDALGQGNQGDATAGSSSVSASATGASGSSTGEAQSSASVGTGGAGGSPTGTGGQSAGGAPATTVGPGAGGSGGVSPCGNGVLDASEGCDDANVTPGDGCSTTCGVEGNANVCPTQAEFTVTPVWIADTTVGKSDVTYTAGCGGQDAGDLVYRIIPATTGTLTATLTGNWDKILAVREGCQPSDGFCNDGDGEVTVSLDVKAGVPAHVVVSGLFGAEGDFQLYITVQ